MKQDNKIRVAVLYGGRSVEHEVSMQSAANVIEHLEKAHFDVIPIGIDKQGNWFLGKDVFTKSLAANNVEKLQDNSKWFTPAWIGKPSEKQQIEESKKLMHLSSRERCFDVVFPTVHGPLCEDGTLQGLLELADIPYVGCGVLASAIGMDKDVAKRLVKAMGVNIAPYLVVKKEQWESLEQSKFYQEVEASFGFPVFVKPANTGSSVGILKVKSSQELAAAINHAFNFDRKVLIEKAIDAIELEIAVLESLEKNGEPIISKVGEIKSSHEFYSYAAKYLDENGAKLSIPAPIPEGIQEEARAVAKLIFSTLECEAMARVDLFLERNTQRIYFNEINTIPGFTEISMYPKLMQASGISYAQLLKHLIELAIKRHKDKSQLTRNCVY